MLSFLKNFYNIISESIFKSLVFYLEEEKKI